VSFNAVENLEKPMKTVLYRKRAKYHCEKFGKAITATAAVAYARWPKFHKIFKCMGITGEGKAGQEDRGHGRSR
jgi:hypothetical protein